MKVGFIGLGRMGGAMVGRLLQGGHEVGVYNRTPAKLKPFTDAGAKAVDSIKAAAQFGDAVFTMVSDDAGVFEVVEQTGGLKDSLPKGGIHICSGTHSVAAINRLKDIHAAAGQFFIASPMLGRPEVVAAGQAGTVVGGPPDVAARCRPLFAAIARSCSSLRLRGVSVSVRADECDAMIGTFVVSNTCQNVLSATCETSTIMPSLFISRTTSRPNSVRP